MTSRHGALLIFDEVMTGFRLAYGGAQQLYGIRPDLTTLGKVIGGGLPIGAYGGRTDIMSKVAPLGPVYQAGTLSGNPLAVSAGLAMLRYLKSHPEVYPQLDHRAARLVADVPAGLTVNRVGSMFTVLLLRRAGDGLRLRQTVRHGPLRRVLPLHAGARHLPGAVAIRSGLRLSRAHQPGYRAHGRRRPRILRFVNHLAAHHRHQHAGLQYFGGRHGHDVAREHHEIGQLARRQRSLALLLERRVRPRQGPASERFLRGSCADRETSRPWDCLDWSCRVIAA